MLNIRPWLFQNRKKGFTLIELILTLGLSALIILPLSLILNLSTNSCFLAEEREDLMLNGNYALEYIKSEIKSGDKIISADKITKLKENYPTNIGFVIMTENKKKNKYGEYELYQLYHTYHTSENKLIRIACEFEKGKYSNGKYPSQGQFKGFNTICEFVDSIDKSSINLENSIINLNLELKHGVRSKLNLKSDIYIRCEIDY